MAAGVTSRWRGAAWWLVALALAAGTVHWQYASQQRPHTRYTRFELPAFDAWVYVAMAEQPRFFTLAPWGYRVLTPWAADALPGTGVVGGFRTLTLGSLTAAGVLLFALLRRRGHPPLAGLVAVAVLGLAPPMREVTSHPFLTDPLTLALFVAFLYAVEAGAATGVLALLLLLATLSKELALMLIPMLLLRAWPAGPGKALRRAVLVALPSLLAVALLRAAWAPQLAAGAPPLDPGWIARAAGRVLAGWRDWIGPLMLLGATPLALRGLWRAERGVALGYGSLGLVAMTVPFLASVYGGDQSEVNFFPADVRRLLLYALPPLLVLALRGLEPWLAAPAPRPAAAPRPLWGRAAWGAAALVLLLLPLTLDRYRRIDLSGQRDGPRILSVVRETLRGARRLEAGEAVVLDPARQRFVWGESDPGQMDRMRWPLLEGWGVHPHYGTGEVVLHEPRGTLILPCLVPRPLALSLALVSPEPLGVGVFVNGEAVGRVEAGPAGEAAVVDVPAAVLFRGDNVLALLPDAIAGPLALRRVSWRRQDG